MIFPGDEWKGARQGSHKRHWVKWDPRSKWKRYAEWPLRKFYVVNYDPFIWVPEEELVWDTPTEAEDARESYVRLLFVVIGTIVMLYIMSLFFL
jgi:hypothetical protein